jgi:hypothetical protein
MNEIKPNSKFWTYVGRDDVGTITIPSEQRSVKWTDTRSGVDNPRYKSQIKAGTNASTDFVGVKNEIVHDTGCSADFSVYNKLQKKNQRMWGKGYYLNGPSFSAVPVLSSSADNVALGKFYASARKAQTSMQGLTFLGELAEAIHMIRHPAQGLRGAVKSTLDLYANLVKRYAGKRLNRKQLQQELANLYLEGVFGWLPLIADIKSGLEAYDKLMSDGPTHLQCRGFGNETKQVSSSSGIENIYTSNYLSTYNFLSKTEVQVVYYGAVRGTVTGGASIEKAKSLFGFRADEFVPTLWELCPWSFLVDYFTNIGDIVSAATYVNANLAWCSKTTRQISSQSRSGIFKSFLNNIDYVTSGSGSYAWETKTTRVVRTANIVPGIPGLELSLPGSNAKWANIAALVAQSRSLSTALSKLL